MKIIIDTDPGHDDALAIMLACKSSSLDVLCLTTVAGNSTIANTTRNARFVLGFLGRNDIPVFSGASKPLSRRLCQAVVHGKSGLEGIDPTNAAHLTNDAPKRIIDLVRTNPGEITIVALGPLTNIAAAIERNPDVMRKVQRIVMMGGAINVPGNMNRVAEFNFFVDPEAADIVARFPVPKQLVPLDACNGVVIGLENLHFIRDKSLRTLLNRMLKPYIANIAKDTGINGAVMYDPLTIFSLLNPRSCKIESFNMQVETIGEVTRGMSVVDKRQVTDGKLPNVDVVLSVDTRAFARFFNATLNL